MTKLGSIIAWLLVGFGTLRAATGLYVAVNFEGEANAIAAQRYLATPNSGDAIDQGLMLVFIGVVLGLLVKIAKRNT